MHIATEIPCSSVSVRTPSPVWGQHSTIVAAPTAPAPVSSASASVSSRCGAKFSSV
jgi:hypothetical protein